jgi:hypothetical protein
MLAPGCTKEERAMPSPLPTRAARGYRQRIEAAADEVFALLCPVRESEWLDGWSCRMVHSVSGVAEHGAVFVTASAGEADTTWVITRHEPASRRIDFCRFTPGSRTCLLRLAVSPLAAARATVDISYEYTALSEDGAHFLARWTDEAFLEAMRFWEASMNHFLATGRRLARGDSAHAQPGGLPVTTRE